MRRFVVAYVMLVCLVVPLLVESVWADDGVPVNGDFVGSLSGWINYDSSLIQWVSGAGHGGSGAVQVTNSGYLMSEPFRVVDSGSELTWWGRCVSEPVCITRVQVWNWTSGDRSTSGDFYMTPTEASSSYSLASWDGQVISIGFTEYWNPSLISSVSVSNAINVTTNEYRGDFTGGYSGWQVQFLGCGGSFSSSVGHDSNGAFMIFSGCDNRIRSVPFLSSGGYWRFYVYGGSSVSVLVRVYDYTVGGNTFDTLVNHSGDNLGGTWVGYEVDLSSYDGHFLSWDFYLNTNGTGDVYLDDVCPYPSGCSGYELGTETPTLVATNTLVSSSTPLATDGPGGGGGYPTQIPYPTPIYGVGTPAPVGGGGSTGLCPSDDPCYVLNPDGTPIHVFVDGGTVFPYGVGTPIPIQGGNSTPVIVAFATANFTPIAARMDLVTQGSTSNLFNPSDLVNPAPIDIRSGAPAFPISLGVQVTDLQICLPGQVATVISVTESCASFKWLTFGSLGVGAVNFLVWLAPISVVFLIVFVIRQLQER